MNNTSKKVNSPTLIIEENILRYKDSVIQISNIAKCEIAPEPPKPYPSWLFIGLIIGALLMFNVSSLPIGLFAVIIFGVIFYMIYSANSKLATYFILELNSGYNILFYSHDRNFLWKAENALIDCFNHKEEKCIINFSDCTITHSQIGEGNIMKNSEEQNGN